MPEQPEPAADRHSQALEDYLALPDAAPAETRKALWLQLSRAEKQEALRRGRATFFVPPNAVPEQRAVHRSPTGRYRLSVTPYRTREGYVDFSLGEVFLEGQELPVAAVRRNYSAFPFAFVEGHPNGHDYLVCGEDYQSQTVVELDTGTRRDFLPETAFEGFGFCWAAIAPSPDGLLLAVDGCHWAAPYEVRVMDFRDPLEPPYSLVGWITDSSAVSRWVDAVTLELELECLFRRSDGKPWPELTDSDRAELRAQQRAGRSEEDLLETRMEKSLWHRPTDLEAARELLRNLEEWWVRRGRQVPADLVEVAQLQLARLPEVDRRSLGPISFLPGP